jgi:hypothetical protein
LSDVEPKVRTHEQGATARLTSLHARLKHLLDSSEEGELDPEQEVEAQELLQNMHFLIEAAQANVFKGVVVKGPREFKEEQIERERRMRVSAMKDELAWQWALEDHKDSKKKKHVSSGTGAAAAVKKERKYKLHTVIKKASVSQSVEPKKLLGFGSKGYKHQENNVLAAADARAAKRKRASQQKRRVVSSSSEDDDEEEEEEEEEQEQQQGAVQQQQHTDTDSSSSNADADDDAEGRDPSAFRTPKRQRTSRQQQEASAALWPISTAITPSTAAGIESSSSSAAPSSAALRRRVAQPAAALALHHRHNRAPPAPRDGATAGPRPRSIRRRPLVLPSKEDSESADELMQPTQPMLEDGKTPAIFLSIIAERKAAAANAPQQQHQEAESPVIRKRPSARSAAAVAACVADVPLPNQELLLQANWRAGRFSLSDEAVSDEPMVAATAAAASSSSPSPSSPASSSHNENQPPATQLSKKSPLAQLTKSKSAIPALARPLLPAVSSVARAFAATEPQDGADPFAFDL